MMNASLAKAQDNYEAVYDYPLQRIDTVGRTLPIVIGETGWKWRQTTPTQEIEVYAALPVNAKWYSDLLRNWEGSAERTFDHLRFRGLRRRPGRAWTTAGASGTSSGCRSTHCAAHQRARRATTRSMRARVTTHLEPRRSAAVDNTRGRRYLVRRANEVDFDLVPAFP